MRRRIRILTAGTILVVSGVIVGTDARQSSQSLPPSAERAYLALASRFNAPDAFEIVTFMDRYWRLAANPGYNASIDHIRERLLAAGFSTSAGARAAVHVEEFTNQGRGWDYRVGSVAFDEGAEPPLLSRES